MTATAEVKALRAELERMRERLSRLEASLSGGDAEASPPPRVGDPEPVIEISETDRAAARAAARRLGLVVHEPIP